MRRLMFALAAFALTGAVVATAEDPKPAPQPKAAQPKVVGQPAVQPLVQPKVTAARMAQLEEEFETLEAQREVRKAQVKAAQVSVEATKDTYELHSKLSPVSGPQIEIRKAKYDFEMAKAQLAIREAELKEIEVKVKFAKKRLDEAKAAGVRPLPGVKPVPIDPPPPGGADEAQQPAAELKAKLAHLQAEVEKKKVERKKAEADLDAHLAAATALDQQQGIPPEVRAKAREKVAAATELRATIERQQSKLERQLDELKEELKKLEKPRN